ncbi:MAG TPA: trypsin-like serine protease [Tepidisphaeraceae bacterium]|nr:trypsin-like serine protease [Tepidisphaeraceae bacterium]
MRLSRIAAAVCGLLPFFATAPISASTTRTDVSDSLYTALGNDPKYASVGAVLWPVLSSPTLSNAASGVLISPKWVLTAGHVADTFTTDNTTRTFIVGGTTFANGTSYTVIQHFANPAWNGTVAAGNDIGLMLLNTPVGGITPASRYFSGGELHAVGTSVGFGETGTGTSGEVDGSYGTKRAVQNNIDVFGPVFSNQTFSSNILASDFDAPFNDGRNGFGTADALPLEGSIAPGDSGGGTFIDTASGTYVAAVHSFQSAFQNGSFGDGTANASYSDWYGSTRTTPWDSWIDDSIANTWKTAVSGSFATNANWSMGPTALANAPDPADIVGFSAVGTYTVTLSSSLANWQLLSRGGNVTMNLGGNAYSLTANSFEGSIVVGRYSGNNASMTFTNGVLNSNDASIAELPGSTGHLTIGNSTAWNASGNVYVGGTADGAGGSGNLSIASASAAVSISGRLKVWSGSTVNYNAGDLAAGTLDIDTAAHVLLASGKNKVLNAGLLSITGTGQLDLADNNMDAGSTSLDSLRNFLHSGYNGGAWNGSGIISSNGNAARFALGYAQASTAHISNFFGEGVNPGDDLVEYTLFGDTDLDGDVDNADFGNFFSHFGMSSGADWSDGDFDYDGDVDNADFGIFFTNFGLSGLTPPPQMLAFAQSIGFAVPEPTILSAIALTLIPLRRPRRK